MSDADATPLPEPDAQLVMTDVEQLRVVSDPLRLEMLELMAQHATRSWTAKELASELGTKQTKLYHHLGLLEERGFIRVAETRMVSGIQERRYQVTARSFTIDRSLLAGAESQPAVTGALDVVLGKARDDILAALRSGAIQLEPKDPKGPKFGLWMTHARLSPASVKRVMRMVQRLAEIDDQQDPDGVEYGLLVGFYPRAGKGTTSKETDR